MLNEQIKESVLFHVKKIEEALGKIEQGVDVTDRIIDDAKEIADLFLFGKTKTGLDRTALASVVNRAMKKVTA
jgi:hypothetical protein